jgi:hypothetical protein
MDQENQTPQAGETIQPGQSMQPQVASDQVSQKESVPTQPQQPTQLPTEPISEPIPSPAAQQPEVYAETPTELTQSNQFTNERTQHPLNEAYEDHRPPMTHDAHGTDEVNITWEASEYVMHHKSSAWFMGLGVGTAVFGALLWVALQDILAIIVVLLMGVSVVMYAVRKPHTLQYSISDDAIIIGHKEFTFDNFRSFSVMQDGGLNSLLLLPTKRFSPSISVYFADSDSDVIMDALAQHLPHEDREPDFIDRISRTLRF